MCNCVAHTLFITDDIRRKTERGADELIYGNKQERGSYVVCF